jgi:hypothetical protein
MQLVLRNSGRIPMIAVIPHVVGSGSKGLDSMLDEGSDKLDARKLLLRSGSKLLDLLHQRLHDLHLVIREIMPPGHTGSKDGGGLKFLEPEGFTVGELVLGIEPFCPPAGVVFGRLEGEVRDFWTHLIAEAASLEL